MHTLEDKIFDLEYEVDGVWRAYLSSSPTPTPTPTTPTPSPITPTPSPISSDLVRYASEMTAYMPPQDLIGFTVVSPSLDSQVIYVSYSEGSDANDGFSETSPVQSLAAGLALAREGFPDHVLLKRGDVWPNTTLGEGVSPLIKSGRSETEPQVLSYYGASGNRPTLEYQGVFFKGEQYYLQFFHLIGLAFHDTSLDFDHANFTGVSTSAGNQLRFFDGNNHILVEDCKSIFTELKFQAYDTDQNDDLVATEYPQDVFIRRNIFTGIYFEEAAQYGLPDSNTSKRPSNMYISGVRGQLLIEDNVFDYGGWTADPRMPDGTSNTRNHNVYMQYGMSGVAEIRVRNNIVVRGSHLGFHGRSGGYFEDNYFARNSIGMQMGYPGYPMDTDTPAVAHRNVIAEGYNVVRGEQNPDGTWTNETNAGSRATWGINTEEIGEAYVSIKDNIVAEIHDTGEWRKNYEDSGLQTWDYSGAQQNTIHEFENNIAWNWTTSPDYSNAENYVDPGRKLSDYNESLGGSNDFDEFMDRVKNREVGAWDFADEAISINAYIRAGYQVVGS